MIPAYTVRSSKQKKLETVPDLDVGNSSSKSQAGMIRVLKWLLIPNLQSEERLCIKK